LEGMQQNSDAFGGVEAQAFEVLEREF